MAPNPRKIAKPAAGFGLIVTVVSIWWFALRPRRKHKHED
jgi:cbb3-type cytochrome oxidase subunit 3